MTGMRHNNRFMSLSLGRLLHPRSRTAAFNCGITQRRLAKRPKEWLRQYRRSTTAVTDSTNVNARGSQTEHDDETIEAVFVFHRHGDRTPGRSLVAEELEADESEFWKTKIPPTLCYETLCERFPAIKQSSSNDNTNSTRASYESFQETSGGNRSYGILTWRGLHQMHHHGRSMARKYGAPNDASKSGQVSFRECWDVQAKSTNYLRTVMSCQAFLDGLLTHSSNNNSNHDDNTPPLDYDYPTHYEQIPLKDHQRKDKHNSNNHHNVDILVRDAESETLNAFESSPTLMKNLMGNVFATPEFIANDQQAKSLKSELVEYLPGLSKHSTYGNMPSPSGEIRINWIHAADHFVCRLAHSVPVPQFCPHLGGTEADEALRFDALGKATLSHLSQRFHGYYSNSQLLAEMAGPALDEVLLEIKEATSTTKKMKKPFRIYSCHDVTILALLYAIQGIESTTQPPPAWPTYATCLTLELVKIGNGSSNEIPDVAPTFVIRAWLSEAPIPTFSPSPVAFDADRGEEPCFSIELSRFEALVRNLNEARVPNGAQERHTPTSE